MAAMIDVLFSVGRKLPLPVKRSILATMRAPWRIVNQVTRADEKRRLKIAMNYVDWRVKSAKAWAKLEKEESNFYYNLNKDHLAHLIEAVTGSPYDTNIRYFVELENDKDLRDHLTESLKQSGYGKDIRVEYARRIGWYAVARATKPKVIIETGIDHGVGSCVLASALIRNKTEGFCGKYFGTDLNPSAGRLFSGKYAQMGEILYGDSIRSLEKFAQPIDLFINDSDHSATYEAQEYETITDKLAKGSIILGDNSHATDSLAKYSRAKGRSFLFFGERPQDHWYPGAGIGISYERRLPHTAAGPPPPFPKCKDQALPNCNAAPHRASNWTTARAVSCKTCAAACVRRPRERLVFAGTNSASHFPHPQWATIAPIRGC
jgi:predicted O-methyltransferase YrrM